MRLAATASTLDGTADGPVHTDSNHTDSNIDDDIARAFLRKAAATPATAAGAALGGTVRNWQGRLQDEQRVSSLAWLLCVERKFLYRAPRV